jgi:toxin secretion/phage lysis holin
MKRLEFDGFFAIIGGIAGFMFGSIDGLFIALVAFAVLDYLTGVISAILKKNLSSRVGFDGIFKKTMMFVLVALANIIDVQVLGGDYSILRTAVITFLLANEGLSILENAARMGVPIPKKLLNILEQLKEKSNNDSAEKEENQ